ncbi:TPA: YSIRK-type signal peptide-containing protein, partial [Streptococcus pyogenes]
MTRQQTKKNYSLRKLKTGTASVAVALTVLGAGFANQTEVRADDATKQGTNSLYKYVEQLEEEREKLEGEKVELLDKVGQLEQQKQQEQKEQKERQKKLEQLEHKYQV